VLLSPSHPKVLCGKFSQLLPFDVRFAKNWLLLLLLLLLTLQ